ncbi:MAG: gamma-glutamyl-gamma-aminobutyrate hydrolase family protein [Micavibrio aeruginosavorus]|uniref:Gamma-glutamyl-gamma-aminobutyrate hydrolase family protein n=1 Tax=Micavibrio aeruginosavorus TaxID=349221 RepID=A0A7T5UI47_9BACT|nr:MAG: gamma-glutamyl-gamma-aminobutyrate hydrolase family protein [Micavibrio aeruginosavorus]
MKIVGISQRVIVNKTYPERRDALAQEWHGFLAAAGLVALPLPNNVVAVRDLLRQVPVAGFILSGGNDLVKYGGDAPERDEVESFMLEQSKKEGLPVLGVCRGLQFMNVHEGGTLQTVVGHVGTRHKLDNGRTVNSYHNYALAALAPGFSVEHRAGGDGTVESLRHDVLPWRGVMWHPERETAPDQEDVDLFQEVFLS